MNSLQNGLIAQQAPLDQALLLRKAQICQFDAGDILVSPNLQQTQIFFVTSGVVALFVCQNKSDTSSGLAVGLVGAEGALGVQLALGLGAGNWAYIAQARGQAYSIDSALVFRLVRRKSAALLAFATYMCTQYEDVTRMATISLTQDVRMRLAHWLLLSAQRSGHGALILTHSQIAHMLGVRRASITLAAREMKLMGVIGYSRGHIQLKNIEALKRLAKI